LVTLSGRCRLLVDLKVRVAITLMALWCRPMTLRPAAVGVSRSFQERPLLAFALPENNLVIDPRPRFALRLARTGAVRTGPAGRSKRSKASGSSTSRSSRKQRPPLLRRCAGRRGRFAACGAARWSHRSGSARRARRHVWRLRARAGYVVGVATS
jgi:hypothetical protein